MRSRIARFGVLGAAVLGLFAGSLPAAHAQSVITAVFAGNAVVAAAGNNTIAYPCVYQPLPGVLPADPVEQILGPLCLGGLVPPSVSTKPDPKGVPTVNVDTNHNTSGVVFGSVGCVAGGLNILKNKHLIEANTCSITATGTVSGHCGLATGNVTGALVDAGPLPNTLPVLQPLQTYVFSIKFTGLAALLVLTGTVTLSGGGAGNVTGLAVAIPNPAAGSCTDKHALGFVIAGAAALLFNL